MNNCGIQYIEAKHCFDIIDRCYQCETRDNCAVWTNSSMGDNP